MVSASLRTSCSRRSPVRLSLTDLRLRNKERREDMPPKLIMHLAAAVPPEIAGLPTWALNGLSIGGLVMLILMGLFTSKLWTKRQVDELVKQHEREVNATHAQHVRETEATIARYETHLTRTIELYQGRVDDALTRE